MEYFQKGSRHNSSRSEWNLELLPVTKHGKSLQHQHRQILSAKFQKEECQSG
uniref:Uncharacterized protein n=1 Tax=Rhizophora mucronata TaxID=61149 RepID=A0A2P2P9S9_RHIMU